MFLQTNIWVGKDHLSHPGLFPDGRIISYFGTVYFVTVFIVR